MRRSLNDQAEPIRLIADDQAVPVPSVEKLLWHIAPDFPADPNARSLSDRPEPTPHFTLMSLIDHVRSAARRNGAKIALDDGETTLSYHELVVRAERLASRMMRVTEPGEAIGLWLANSAGLHVAILACLAAGRPYIAMDLTSPLNRNRTILQQSGLNWVVTDSHPIDIASETLPDLHYLRLQDDGHEPIVPLKRCPSTDVPAVILFTSGSTGVPKGVVNSERAVLERVRQYIHSGKFTADDVFLPLSSACTIAGTRECFTALALGATLVLASPEKSGLSGLRSIIEDKKITVLNGVPALLRALMAGGERDANTFKNLRMIKVGGDRVLWSDIAQFRTVCGDQCRIQAGYSSTETTATYWEVPSATITPVDKSKTESVPAGYLHSSVAYRIETELGQSAAIGEEGELVIKSPFVALGLWQHGHLTPGPIETDPVNPTHRIFHTSDLVRQLPSGLIDLLGRKDRQVKINGKRVEPTELEVALRQFVDVTDAAVIAVRDNAGTKLAAFVALNSSLEANDDWHARLRQGLRQTLPAMLTPARIHALPQIPRLPSGKQDTVALLAIDKAMATETTKIDAGQDASSPDGSALTDAVSRAWRAVLGKAAFHENRGWDESGGDSLSLLRFVFHLEAEHGHSLPLTAFRMDMRPADCVALLRRLALSHARAGQAVKRPDVFLFPGLTGDSPSLASFRNDLAETARLVLIPYPDWRAMVRGADSILDLAHAAVTTIKDQATEEPLHLIGYSLGGTVAFQTAALLLQEGRDIASFTILDNHIATPRRRRANPVARLTHLLTKPAHERATLTEKLVEQIGVAASHPAFRIWLTKLADKDLTGFSPLWRFNLRNAVWEALQMRAFNGWCAENEGLTLPLSASLFVSEEIRPLASPDLGWSHRVDSLSVHPAKGDHRSMLRAPYRSTLSKHVRQLLDEAFERNNPSGTP